MTRRNVENGNKRHLSTVVLVRRLLRENVRHYFGWLILALVGMAVMAGATALSAWLMEPVVNEVFIAKKRETLWLISAVVLATFAVKGAANYMQATLISYVGLRIIADNQTRLYAHLQRMDLAFFQSRPTGTLISRFTVDITSMRNAVSNALTGFGKDALSLIGLIVVMFVQDVKLALISFLVFPVAVIPIVRLGQRMRRVSANTQEEMGHFTTLLEQTFQGVRVVKAYAMESYEKGRIRAIIERVFNLTLRSARTRALSSPIMETLGGLAVALVIVYGGLRVIDADIDPGSFFSFITALLLAYEPMKRLANLNASLQEGLAGAQRMFDLLDTEPAITERPDARALASRDGTVRLEGVRFAYGSGAPALDGITLEVPAGCTVALVGASGAGKSTILNLIPRFYEIADGAVTIDGVDVRDATFASLYANIALVSQEVTLFDDTVRANIAYGRAAASEDEIVAAARAAGADGFIRELADGYDTVVGEHGIRLSGGQRQRLAIARAILKDAPILLLDEATSALDTESERHVQAAMKKLMRGRTTLVIAHRLSTVIDADFIYVIERGRVAEAGTHAQLLGAGGAYARLYALQFSDAGAPAPV
ncbi:MAG: ABC transporter ATP-binding protein [Rhodospirillales bacterium]|jgi:subfamily B ATP-binding cassette protein MsbA|nr:ABC transporter ATP-binding protein [Rhodospirillales bacterium]MDP6804032.1 ABC transporter ATP-binding protein [Rhodospirillales bacterium]